MTEGLGQPGQDVSIVESRKELGAPVYTQEHRRLIAGHLGACLAVQRTYGKQGGDLNTMTKIFCAALKHYEPKQVTAALEQWMTKSPEFPTPADIKQMIDPEPVWDGAVYTRLSIKARKDGGAMTSEEWEYLRKYEANAIKGI